jgi:hypothetical protein
MHTSYNIESILIQYRKHPLICLYIVCARCSRPAALVKGTVRDFVSEAPGRPAQPAGRRVGLPATHGDPLCTNLNRRRRLRAAPANRKSESPPAFQRGHVCLRCSFQRIVTFPHLLLSHLKVRFSHLKSFSLLKFPLTGKFSHRMGNTATHGVNGRQASSPASFPTVSSLDDGS